MKRKITPEEMHLWQNEMKGVKPLSIEQKKTLSSPIEHPKKQLQVQCPVARKIERRTIGTLPMVPLHKFGRKELRHIIIDARLDLHGMTLEEGHIALEGFLQHAQKKGFKTVLIITGKGALSSQNTLRHYLPRWVEEPPIRNFVSILHHPAKSCDGGQGAFYIGIKRLRK
ncbi:MAG: Smr/MutS family protein [Alphaproteobacteria bacterium]|nr:Smr/MutS family protein [Alphaproteobacteria bacterium]